MSKAYCDFVFECQMRWLQAQPNALQPAYPPPNPERVFFEDVEGSISALGKLIFPQNSVFMGLSARGFIGNYREGFYWVKIDEQFERLMAAHRKEWGPQYDEPLLYEVETSNRFMGLEGLRVRRQALAKVYHENDKALWEGSRSWIVVGEIVDARSQVPDGSDGMTLGWDLSARSLYRPAQELSLIDPDSNEVHVFGQFETTLPPFLETYADESLARYEVVQVNTNTGKSATDEAGRIDW